MFFLKVQCFISATLMDSFQTGFHNTPPSADWSDKHVAPPPTQGVNVWMISMSHLHH